MSLVDDALCYAGREWRVFAVSNKKVPYKGSHGYKDGTTDEPTLRAMFAAHPYAAIGLSTGWHEVGPNIVVVDADGTQGQAAFKSLGLPTTLVAITPSGGWHVFYTLPERVRLDSWTIAKFEGEHQELALKADRTLVLLPPSKRRRWLNPEWPMAELPAAAIERLRKPAPAPRPEGTSEPLGDWAKIVPEWLPADVELTERLRKSFVMSALPDFLQALKQIPVTSGYETFFKVGAGCYDFSPDEIGCACFKGWARSCEEYREQHWQDECDRKWSEYEKAPPDGNKATVASIYYLAEHYRQIEANKALAAPPSPVVPPSVTQAEVLEPIKETNGQHYALPPELTAATPAKILFPDVDHKGKPKATCRNARAAIRGLGVLCEHDTWHGRMYVGGQAIGQWAGELTDASVQMLRVVIGNEYSLDPGAVATFDGATQECLLNPHNPVLDYLDASKWDGVPRLDTWMHVYLGAERSALTDAIARLSLVAAVRRARAPGCKFDQIIVLEGPEGRGKSSAIEILAGSGQFSDQSILSLDDKGQQEAIAGVWLYEIADLAGHSRAEVEKVKAFASRTVDRARPAYGRARQDVPRRCVFFATTNNDTYLQSNTGNRRFWPVVCGHVDLIGLQRDRDQLWAEAAAAEKGASLILPERLWKDAAIAQDSRRDHDPWDDLLMGASGKLSGDGTEWRISTAELLEGRLKLPAEKQSPVSAKRLVYVMRRLGWHGPKVMKEDKITYRGYWRPTVSGE